MLLTLTSVKGAPGVTTTALGLLMTWPRSVLLVEADMAGSSSFLAGWMRGTVPNHRSVINLALPAAQRGLAAEDLFDQAMLARESDGYLIPGIPEVEQASSVRVVWPALVGLVPTLEAAGMDVLVDAGRLGPACPQPLVAGADLHLIVTTSRMPDIIGVSASARGYVQPGLPTDATRTRLLITSPDRPFSSKEIAKAVGLPVAGTLPYDPRGARALSDGEDTHRLPRTGLGRALPGLAQHLMDAAKQRRAALDLEVSA